MVKKLISYDDEAPGLGIPEVVETALNTTYVRSASSASGAAWGSSTIAGGFTSTLGSRLGITIYNGGGGGELIEHHAARAGAVPALVTTPSGQIPSSGAVNVTVENFPTARLNRVREYAGKLRGVPGTLAYSGGSLAFTRASSGDVVKVMPREPFIPDTQQYRDVFTILNVGKNNLVQYGASAVPLVSEYTRRLFNYLGGVDSNVLVLGHFVDTGTPAQSDLRDAILAVNAQYAIDFGAQFVDPQAFLTSEYAWMVSGLTPTATDIADQSAGNKPVSLSADNLHLNAAGNKAVARLCVSNLQAIGKFPHVTLPALPPEPEMPTQFVAGAAPAISGPPAQGREITVSAGEWIPAPDSYTYQWYRNGAPISGATGDRYTLAAADVDQGVTARVTVAKAGYLSVSAAASNSVTVLPAVDLIDGAITSDMFTGGDTGDIVGRSTDTLLGGTPRTWGATASNLFAIESGRLVPGARSAPGACSLPMEGADYEFGVTSHAASLNEGVSTVRIEGRATTNSSNTAERYCVVYTDSYVTLAYRDGGSQTTYQRVDMQVVPGDQIALRCDGDQISAIVNGEVVASVTDTTITAGKFVRIATGTADTTYEIADVYVKSV